MPYYDLTANIDAIEWEIGIQKTDKRTTFALISPELKIIPSTYPYEVLLEERPYSVAGVSITGFSEILVQPTSGLTFYVDYESGKISFSSDDAGKLISIYYYGTGSTVSAADVNKFSTFLSSIRDFLTSFQVEASDPVDTNVSITGGYINTGTAIALIADKILRFGPAQEYVTTAMAAFYWKKLLISVNTVTEAIIVTEGVQAATQALAAIPAVPASCKPIAVISVQDDGNAGAGTIRTIASTYIQDVRILIK